MEITEKDISGAIEAWGAGLIKVSHAYENDGFKKGVNRDIKIKETPIFPFLISSHSSISVDK